MAEHIFFNGRSYYQTPEGYWRSTDRRHKPLHVAVWEDANGAVPEGYEIHHIDGNKSNNTLENLQCLTIAEHRQLHAKKNHETGAFATQTYSKTCLECGREFVTTIQTQKFCSKRCRLVYPKSKGAVIRVCEVCGKEFKTARNRKSRYCSGKCANDGVGKSKFSDETIREIRSLYVEGSREFGLTGLAKKYNVGKSTIQRIVTYETYKNV